MLTSKQTKTAKDEIGPNAGSPASSTIPLWAFFFLSNSNIISLRIDAKVNYVGFQATHVKSAGCFSITASLDCICHSSAVVALQYLSLESRSAPNNVASWFRLWNLWAGRWGAWLFPASRSLFTCSCCRPWRRCWTWSTTLRCLRSSSSLASCSFFAAFFWILSSCGKRVNVTVKPCKRTSLASKSWPFF